MKQKTRKTKKIAFAGICIGVVILLAGFAIVTQVQKINSPSIDSYKQCADAGYAISQSFPETCSVPGGKSFTNTQ